MLKQKLAVTLAACYLSISAYAQTFERQLPNISYVSFQSFDPVNPEVPLTISGELRIPANSSENSGSSGGLPAVLVLHSSGGVDSTGEFYIDLLNDAGIATLEIDLWAARGVSGITDRPALPPLTVPDAFSALEYLSQHSNIDAGRIAVMGFSWGAAVTMLAATEPYLALYGNGNTFAAHVAQYPVCWAYNVGLPGMNFGNLTGSPVLIQVGELDGYDDGSQACENLVASLSGTDQSAVSLNIYPNAHHAWDRLQQAITVFDPFSHRGVGGFVELAPLHGQALQSGANVLLFFQQSMGLSD